ncbi:Undecaprenyl-phosphate 4-deoxy-4-formamido-L-arabinose transferase [Candidatus Ornithobacterium hominis]|uniref:Undecaprenyl-phosphate 4-deoxy-4-formamido-L-arabinose transferase n=1 Tax=Candidatus Ornithobacterium hominis TaxID=2497989 RepID=A0A383TUC7_9FLAO|nr:glycosyltransferase family 2 protein [Candidatus Ornithobacterium hominis]MCT7904385.1 glycosyltransferase family 2 protein [Candidatus Ornithobacterium hominis]SZD71282.1 Undecaprenyl-phosphate 4-deoxy-4-formamido-L-arabinose transferase [Candidatus Ornithobacterium hominis]SZD71958.1 Undecaprenyl-phosphate 4-deoxy-4-formamido-L-arabinose transferase [Candidatus Ornithobacterium hominis]
MQVIENPLLSIVIPVYNEEENVELLSEEVEAALSAYPYELILVDDGSQDATAEKIKALENRKIILIELKKNYGQSLALAAGIDFARGDYIITLDGDLQNDPSDIPMMLQKIEEGDYDVVTGIRVKRQDSFLKTIPSKIANSIVRKATKMDIKDNGCALKVFNRETAKDLNLYGEMHRFINLLAFLNGARIAQVPVKHHSRQFGQSKYGLGRTFKVINDLILIIFLRKYLQRPIHLFGNAGLISLGLGGIVMFYLAIVKFGLGEDIGTRPLLILGVLLLLAGIQLITMGIVVDLLMKTYYESQDMRPYRIRKIYNGSQEIIA